MTTWTLTVTIPVGLILRLAAAYVALGALVMIPADRVLWALYRRRGYPVGAYRAWVASKGARWYPSGIVRWPRVTVSVVAASYRMRSFTRRPAPSPVVEGGGK